MLLKVCTAVSSTLLPQWVPWGMSTRLDLKAQLQKGNRFQAGRRVSEISELFKKPSQSTSRSEKEPITKSRDQEIHWTKESWEGAWWHSLRNSASSLRLQRPFCTDSNWSVLYSCCLLFHLWSGKLSADCFGLIFFSQCSSAQVPNNNQQMVCQDPFKIL